MDSEVRQKEVGNDRQDERRGQGVRSQDGQRARREVHQALVHRHPDFVGESNQVVGKCNTKKGGDGVDSKNPVNDPIASPNSSHPTDKIG